MSFKLQCPFSYHIQLSISKSHPAIHIHIKSVQCGFSLIASLFKNCQMSLNTNIYIYIYMFMYMSLVDEHLKICSERRLAVRGSGLTSQIHIPWP